METADKGQDHKLWVKVVRHDQVDSENNENRCDSNQEELKCLEIERNWKHKEIEAAILEQFNIPKQGVILKLRNQRNSLIPINEKILSNSYLSPYSLQVVKEHQFAKAKESFVQSKTDVYDQMHRNEIADILQRIQILEDEVPELSKRRNEKLLKDIDEMNKTIAFMKQRLGEFEFRNWNGMFKKNPLW